jgi:predicted nucleotidyltransferase
MSQFTLDPEPEGERRIRRDLRLIRETVRKRDPSLRGLILTGGFARGEGTVVDGMPQNDYDLVAVRRGTRSHFYADMADELQAQVGLHIDLAPVWEPRLRFVAGSIFWYETANRGCIIEGDASLLRRIPVRHPTQIAPAEAVRLLANRAAGLLLCGKSAEEMRIQASKALLGALDAQLLSRGIFPPSNRERWATYNRLAGCGIAPLPQHAAFKTRPAHAADVEPAQMTTTAGQAILTSLPGALRFAGYADLAEYERSGTWVERAQYWRNARRCSVSRLEWHPGTKLRADTFRMLAAKVAGRRPHAPRMARASSDPIQALRNLRDATCQ